MKQIYDLIFNRLGVFADWWTISAFDTDQPIAVFRPAGPAGRKRARGGVEQGGIDRSEGSARVGRCVELHDCSRIARRTTAIDAVIQGLNGAKGVAKVAVAGAEATPDILNDIRRKIIEATNPGVTTQQRQILQNDYVNLLGDMRQILENAEFNGLNLLIELAIPFNLVVGQVQNLDVLSNTGGDTLRVGGHRLDLVYARLINEDLNSVANANAALNIWDTNISVVNTALVDLGADSRQLNFQVDNLVQVQGEVTSGLGNIVDSGPREGTGRAHGSAGPATIECPDPEHSQGPTHGRPVVV